MPGWTGMTPLFFFPPGRKMQLDSRTLLHEKSVDFVGGFFS
jgi:hypothetical protein